MILWQYINFGEKVKSMRGFFLAVAFTLSISVVTNGQISSGGHPLEVSALKSRSIPQKIMLPVNNKKLLRQAKEMESHDINLKSLRFAHNFNVNFSPGSDGIWIDNIKGFDIWTLKIRSNEAKSLSLIFDKFHLPKGARLFLFNEEKNHYLGAFTSFNNKASGKFAVSPVAGDVITIQYEVPSEGDKGDDFIISSVNHDFTGILKYDDRRPSGNLPGECNVDINCDIGNDLTNVKDAVCRIISGVDICTGTLLNNTAEDQKPYIISAAHCFDGPEKSSTAVFTFNYESPYCAVIDGDPSNSISGAVMRAYSDSLDFALMELSLEPPPEFRPYYAGWDNSGNIPDSTTTIHHPEGHIKKISADSDKPLISDYRKEYTPDGFLKIVRWDLGVTEPGSSGCPLFTPEQNVIGTLTGGEASCTSPVNDYFSRLEVAWEYKADSSKQLKSWLDPVNQGIAKLQGKRFFTSENLCLAFTNLTDKDIHDNIPLIYSEEFSGYWGGTNNLGITGFAERFSIPGNEILHGISLGVGKIDLFGINNDSQIEINIYNGSDLPETVIHSQTIKVKSLATDAMNFIEFSETVEPTDTFFVGFELTGMSNRDTFIVYQSLRPDTLNNFFFFKQDESWYDFKSSNIENYSMVNVFELVACNVETVVNDTPIINKPLEALVYPNPARSIFTFEAGQTIDPKNISVFNLIGKEVSVILTKHRDKKIQIDLSGNIPGIYFIRLKTQKGIITRKVSYIPW
jgi:lysyl endopeptidase